MTPFQVACIQRCRDILASTPGLECGDLEEVAGRTESYLRARIRQDQSRLIDIYVYRDEAGYMVDEKDWTGYERPDYPSDHALIAAFIDGLQRLLSRGREPQA